MSILNVLYDGLEDTEWHRQAACLGYAHLGRDWFVPPAPNTRGRPAWAAVDAPKAIQVCHGCPVRQLCADWARRQDVTFGVWGGVRKGNGPDDHRRTA